MQDFNPKYTNKEPFNRETDSLPPFSTIKRPRRFGSIIIIILVIIALMAALGVFRGKGSRILSTTHEVHINTKAPIFINTASALGLPIAKYTGFFDVTPDGSKMVFSGLSKDTNSTPQTFVTNLETGEIKSVPGNILSNWISNNLLLLTEGTDAVLHDFTKMKEYRIRLDGNIYRGSISADGKLYIMSTTEGLKLLNLENGIISKVSSGGFYDGAYAWASDNVHIAGFRDSGIKMPSGENARILTLWNITDNTYQDFPVQVPIKSIKYVEWVVPNKVVRVNAGFDDGSHDYLVNISTNQIIDLGETSGMLMGGIKTDSNLGLIALLGSVYSSSTSESVDIARIHDSNGNLLHEVRFKEPAEGYMVQRESVNIVNKDTLLYVRKYFNIQKPLDSKNELVLLNTLTGEENVFRGLSNKLTRASLMDDKDTWITMDTNQFYIGSVKGGVVSPLISDAPIEEKVTDKTPSKITDNPIIQKPTKDPNEEMLRKYLNAHLNELSTTVRPSAGGKFYVTQLQVTNSKSGIVWYEDGHVAARAYFDYTISGSNVLITNFQAERLLITGGKPN